MKGLYVSVLRDAAGYDCTNNGITSKVNRILLIDENLKGLYEPEPDEVYLILKRRNIWPCESDYIHAEPMKNGKPLHTDKCSMAGGNYVTCCDSRISALNRYPIPVHDRYE